MLREFIMIYNKRINIHKENVIAILIVIVFLISNLQMINSVVDNINSINNFDSNLNNQEAIINNLKLQNGNSSNSNIGTSFIQCKIETIEGETEITTSTESDEINISSDVIEGILIENIFNKTIAVIDKSGNQVFMIEPILFNNGNPISEALLTLHFQFEYNWILIDSQYTNLEGKCIFKFKLTPEIIEKTKEETVFLPYRISYEKSDQIISSKSALLIIKDYDGPKVEYIDIYSKTDAQIHMKTYIKCYKEWWHLWTDDLKSFTVKFYTWDYTLNKKSVFKEYTFDYSNDNVIGVTFEAWLNNYLKTGFLLWIYVYAVDDAGFSDSDEVFTTIRDDDSSPPSLTDYDDTSEGVFNGGNIYDNYQNSYYMKVYGTDSSPWGVKIEYKFGDFGAVTSYPYDYRSKGRSWGTTREIPQIIWTQHIGERIYWRYRAHDYDSDSGAGSSDYSYTNWNSWIDGGMIQDDNTHAPTLDKITTTGDIYDSYLEDYEFKIKAQDGSGWKADIEYKFGSDGDIQETTLSTTQTNLIELQHSIPRSTWISHIGKPIYWKYKLSDLDNDRTNDHSSHSWSNWLVAGELIDDDIIAPIIYIENEHNAALDDNYVLFYVKDYSNIASLDFNFKVNDSNEVEATVIHIENLDNEEWGQAFKAFIGQNYGINTKIEYNIFVIDNDSDRSDDSLSSSFSELFYIEEFLVNPKITAFSLSNERLLPGMLFNIEVEIENEGVNKTATGSKIYIYVGEKDQDGVNISPAEEIIQYSISTINPKSKKTFSIPHGIEEEGYFFVFASVELYDANSNSYWNYWFESVDISVKKLQFFITTNTTSMFPGTNLQTKARFLNWAEKATLDTTISLEKYLYDDNNVIKYFLESEYQEFGIVSPQSEVSLGFEDIWTELGLYEYSGILSYNTLQGLMSISFIKNFEVNHPDISYTSYAEYGSDYNEDPYPNEDFCFQLDIFNNADANNITEIEIGLILGPGIDEILWKKSGSINIQPGETFNINTAWHNEAITGHFTYDVNVTYQDAFNVIRSFIKIVEIEIIPVPDLRIEYGDVSGNEKGLNPFPIDDKINGFPLKTTDGLKNTLKFEIEVFNDAHISVDFSATDLVLKSLRKEYNYLELVISIDEDTINAKSQKTYQPEAKVTKTIWFNPNSWGALVINDVLDYLQFVVSIVTKGLEGVSTVTKLFFIINLLVDVGIQLYNFLEVTHYYEKYQYEGTATYTWQNGENGQQSITFPNNPIKISITQHQFNLYIIASILEICSSILLLLASMVFIAAQAVLLVPFGALVYPYLMSIFWAFFAIAAVCDLFKYLCLIWSNNDPIDIDYNYLKNRLKNDVPINTSIGFLTHNTIDNAISIMNTTDHIILNEDSYQQNFDEGNYEICSDLLEEKSELHDRNGINYIEFGKNIQGIFTELQNNEYINLTQENFNQAYTTLNSTGLPDEGVQLLQDIGYTEEQRENLTQAALKYDDFEMVINTTNSIYNISKYFNTYGNYHSENSVNSLNNSINLNLDYLNHSITKTSANEQHKLDNLKYHTEMAVSEFNWNNARYWATELKNYSKYIILKTNNQTYNEYLEYALDIIRYVELMLSLDLVIPVKEIQIKPGVGKNYFLNIANNYDESITCEIVIEAQSKTWFTFNDTIEIGPYDSVIVPLEIYVPKDYTIIPGEYQINVSIQRNDDTYIRDNSFFSMEILPFYDFTAVITNTSSRVINPGETVEYSILVGNLGNCDTDFLINFIPSITNPFINYPDNFSISLEPGCIYNETFHIDVLFNWIGISEILFNFSVEIIIIQNGFSKKKFADFSVNPTVTSYYRYIKSQIENLKIYIEENLCWKAIRKINRYLDKSLYYLDKAYDCYILNQTNCSICYFCKAKKYINLALHKTSIYHKIGWIGDDDNIKLISELRNIRNGIIILIGFTTGIEIAYKSALIVEKLYNLCDIINDELSNCYSKGLQNLILTSAKFLEYSIILILLNRNTNCTLFIARKILEIAKIMINCMLKKDKISEEFASYLVENLSFLQSEFKLLS